MKDFRVKVSVRNNALLEWVEKRGHRMGPAFCEKAGVHYQQVGDMAAMRMSPTLEDGSWRPIVLKLADFLECLPEDLFRLPHLTPLSKSNVERKVDAQEVFDLLNAPEEGDASTMLEHKELTDVIDDVMQKLTDRERDIVERHTMGDETYDQIAKSYNLSRDRIRQIECKALRKMRHPMHSERLLLADRGYIKEPKREEEPWEFDEDEDADAIDEKPEMIEKKTEEPLPNIFGRYWLKDLTASPEKE